MFSDAKLPSVAQTPQNQILYPFRPLVSGLLVILLRERDRERERERERERDICRLLATSLTLKMHSINIFTLPS